ncbi:protein kinase domain-containing protein [Dyadobacter luticola]|uniref:Protein kinase family protein n=1 Tax=Dyadobacter luticola TaxID=1979387 RepID=A0A5R9KVP9_9BACT|nr:protein kinase [Dyadobacter luticola]TLV00343.1 protein kinase family protein [Dyadobacter luticola]
MEFRDRSLVLSEVGGELVDELNEIVNDGTRYHLKYLSSEFKFSKGGNSNVYALRDSSGRNADFAIKICNYSSPGRNASPHVKRRHGRFMNEIFVLRELKEKGKQNIIQIEFDGVINVDNRDFPYYVMEKADTDLKEYILGNNNLDDSEKVKLCLDIYNSIKELHDEGYYHRDIKPDNVLLSFKGGETATWKLCDLGIVAHREKDYDDIGERIGPIGWLSPEAMNKLLTQKANIGFDCVIDDKSDIFQLGKLFWFIFQGNTPIGQLELDDFICEIVHKDDIFTLIKEMLRYSKEKRADREMIDLFMGDIAKRYAVA